MADAESSAPEEWRAIPDYPDYQVSSMGRVRRVTSRTVGKAGHILKSRPMKSGHIQVQVWREGKSKTITVSRLMALAFHGSPPEPWYHAAHNDGDPSNNSVGNIRWATPLENKADQYLHGRGFLGERHPCVILTDEKVLAIREKRMSGATLEALGREFGVHLSTVWLIVQRKHWTHLP